MSVEKKAESSEAEGFLSRWSRVKENSQATLAQEKLAGTVAVGSDAETQKASIGRHLQPKAAEDARQEPSLPAEQEPVGLPALESMTPQSDYSPFMARDVDPKLRNLAMKKLFTDPHYNVMDRLDIYIDDYSTHAPLPIEVIRQMSISKTLGLFDEEEKDDKDAGIADSTLSQVISAETAAPELPDRVAVPLPLDEEISSGGISTDRDQPKTQAGVLTTNK